MLGSVYPVFEELARRLRAEPAVAGGTIEFFGGGEGRAANGVMHVKHRKRPATIRRFIILHIYCSDRHAYLIDAERLKRGGEFRTFLGETLHGEGLSDESGKLHSADQPSQPIRAATP